MSAREPKLQCALEGVGSPITHVLWETPQVNLMYPADNLGSRKVRKGQRENTSPTASRLSPTVRTRETPGRMLRQVEVGRREPYEMPMPDWGVGRDIIV